MASKQTISECMSILGLMKAGNEEAWTDDRVKFYAHAMAPWEDDLCRAVVNWCANNLTWRPSRAELIQCAARLASPYPSASDCYAEIMEAARRFGLNGIQDPLHPAIFYPGQPQGFHPITRRHIDALGGWERICTGEANLEGGLRKAVAANHTSIEAAWCNEVGAQLALPAHVRNPAYFPQWKPVQFTPEPALPPMPRLTPPVDAQPAPPAIAAQIKALTRGATPERTASHA